jgi:hypothetical protein
MDLTLLPAAAFAATAIVLLAVGALAARRLRAVPILIPAQGRPSMLSLNDAAAKMAADARRESMVIATVAEKAADGAASWFAFSMASVVPVYRKNEAGAFLRVEADAEIGSVTADLYIRKRDYPVYLRWARSVQ